VPGDQARQARPFARPEPRGNVSVREISPDLEARGRRFAVVAAAFNGAHVERMVQAALDVLRRQGVADDDLTLVRVPGSYELPLAARWLAEGGRVDAVLAFGVVIQGETEHFRLVADAASE